MQTRNASASSFDSPFKGTPETTKIPSFAAYRNKGGETGPKVFQYFMVGTMGALSALGAKATVQGMSPAPRQSNGGMEIARWNLHGIFGVVGEQLAIFRMICIRELMENRTANPIVQQTSSSTCLPPPMFWPKLRLKSTSLPFLRARMYVLRHQMDCPKIGS